MKNKIIAIGVLFLPFILAGIENYHPNSLPFVSEIVTPFVKEKKGVYVAYRTYNGNDSKKYLDRDLVSRGYLPVQITIQNNTAVTYLFSKEGCSLKQAKPNSVAWSVTKSSIPRSIGYKIAGFLFWPFMIPGTIDSIRTFHTHNTLRKDFQAKSIKDKDKEEAILPYSTVHRIAFVEKEDYHEDFRVSLIDQDSEDDIVFDSPEMTRIEDENAQLEETIPQRK